MRYYYSNFHLFAANIGYGKLYFGKSLFQILLQFNNEILQKMSDSEFKFLYCISRHVTWKLSYLSLLLTCCEGLLINDLSSFIGFFLMERGYIFWKIKRKFHCNKCCEKFIQSSILEKHTMVMHAPGSLFLLAKTSNLVII